MVAAGVTRPLATGARATERMRGIDMREITNSFKVYQLDELEPSSRQRAIDTVRERLAGDWWDQDNIEDIGNTITYAFAERLAAPGWDTYGEADFPGIDGVTQDGWDLGRGQYVLFRGTLTRENAPALPWTDDVFAVHLERDRDHTHVWVAAEDIEGEQMSTAGRMKDAVSAAMYEALKAGERQLEHLGSEENALGDIEANEREFHEDGRLYNG
jgi:hypothetical protein